MPPARSKPRYLGPALIVAPPSSSPPGGPSMEDPSIDEDTLTYVRRVHNALALKQLELGALALRFEPPKVLKGPQKKRAPPDAQQFPHVLRRYDESLSFLRGYNYNPHRAYFDRDAYGTGKLAFEPTVTLLGTQQSQDRWSQASDSRGKTDVGPSRGARLDAFFAMLERRQATTELVGMAPTCVFVGEQRPLEALQAAGSRTPPRPATRRIPSHRYRRFCISVRSRSPLFGDILCAALVERSVGGDSSLRIHTLCSGDAVTRDPDGRDWRLRVIQDVSRQWRQLSLRTHYAVFDRPIYDRAFVDTPTACPAGDHELIYRLGLLLESPNLQYAPWTTGVRIGSLGALLDLAPPDRPGASKDLTPQLWMRYALMSRVYPYALLATKHMEQVMRYSAYQQDTPLTQGEVQLFRDSVRPAADTIWLGGGAARPRPINAKPPPPTSPTGTVAVVGTNGTPSLARHVRRRAGRGPQPRFTPPPKTKPQPPPEPEPEPESEPEPGDDQEPLRRPQGAAEDTLAFVERLHGYGPGKLQELFGEAARAWAAGEGDSPAWLLNDGKLRTNVGGLGRDPNPGSPWLYAGWNPSDVGRVLRNQIRIRYEWVTAETAAASLPSQHRIAHHGGGGGGGGGGAAAVADPEDREMRAFFRTSESLPPTPPTEIETGTEQGAEPVHRPPHDLVQATARAFAGEKPEFRRALTLMMGLVMAAGQQQQQQQQQHDPQGL